MLSSRASFAALAALEAMFVIQLRAETTIDIGNIRSSAFRIDIPERWNHDLILYLHGYTTAPVSFDRDRLDDVLQRFVDRGYAIAQPGFSAGGWAVAEGSTATLELEDYFTAHYGKPKRTYVAGMSLGGFLVMVLLEEHPDRFNGGLALCAPLGSADWFMARRVFDTRIVFDFYFPGLLPSPVTPSSRGLEPSVGQALGDALEHNPTGALAIRSFLGVKSNAEVAYLAVFFSGILDDVIRRSGGNPFDNSSTVYRIPGQPDLDRALNSGVKRFRGDARAQQYLKSYFPATGVLQHPLVSVVTVYDPLIPDWLTNSYETLAERAGSSRFFEQLIVNKDGHCAFDGADVQSGFAHLIAHVEQ
jgi:pimeloyl-ACP methyl ester carboxylesterase